MRKTIDLVVFDWDGTLIDSIGWIVNCIQHAARECRCPVPNDAEARSIIGLGLAEAMERLFPDTGDQTRACLVESYRTLYASWSISPQDLFPGVVEMLVSLRNHGYQLAVATGKSRAGLRSAMSGTQTTGLFDSTRCADETCSKPDPLMLFEIMQELNAVPVRTLMVGDTRHDLGMARNAGVRSIAVTCGADPGAVLQEFEPQFFIQNPAELGVRLTCPVQCEEEAG